MNSVVRSVRSVSSALAALTVVAGLVTGSALAQNAEDLGSPDRLLGQWRLTRAVVAPWAPATTPIQKKWIGTTLNITPEQVKGPGPLNCTNVRYGSTLLYGDGVFQGNLPEPYETTGPSLGLREFPVEGISMACTSGIFEFHWAGRAMLFALDNVIWTMDRSPGAIAPPTTSTGIVQSFLEAHFNGDMGFDEPSVAAKQQWLSHKLKIKLKAYFARSFPEDVVPPVNGDPFTDSQEYPTRFWVDNATTAEGRGQVPVEYSDGFVDKKVTFIVVREKNKWRIEDVKYEQGGTLSELLTMEP